VPALPLGAGFFVLPQELIRRVSSALSKIQCKRTILREAVEDILTVIGGPKGNPFGRSSAHAAKTARWRSRFCASRYPVPSSLSLIFIESCIGGRSARVFFFSFLGDSLEVTAFAEGRQGIGVQTLRFAPFLNRGANVG
jgi:hypothetical protein